MRAVLAVLTALPSTFDDDDDGSVQWALTAVVGLGLGLMWFMVHQLTVGAVGPLVGGAVVVGVGAMVTGSRPFRGLADVAGRVTGGAEVRGAPGVEGAATLAVVLFVVAQVALLQRVNLAPAMIVVVPLIGRVVQVLLLGDDDGDVGVPPVLPVQKVILGIAAVLLSGVPHLVATLERPVRLNGPLVGLDYAVLGLAALVAGLLAGRLVLAWLRARIGSLDPSGWHLICLVAETTALVVVAVPIA